MALRAVAAKDFMFKRISILEKRAGDDQASFSRHWQNRHGPLVARLPGLRAYVQNHVEERYGPASFRVAGVVELQFDDAAAMSEAFAGDASRDVTADEANFLGGATGYVIGESVIRPADGQGKLLVVARGGGETALDDLEAGLRTLPDVVHLLRDDVVSTFTRPGSDRSGQKVGAFFHVYFDDVAAARRAGTGVAGLGWGSAEFGVFRMRTARIV